MSRSCTSSWFGIIVLVCIYTSIRHASFHICTIYFIVQSELKVRILLLSNGFHVRCGNASTFFYTSTRILHFHHKRLLPPILLFICIFYTCLCIFQNCYRVRICGKIYQCVHELAWIQWCVQCDNVDVATHLNICIYYIFV